MKRHYLLNHSDESSVFRQPRINNRLDINKQVFCKVFFFFWLSYKKSPLFYIIDYNDKIRMPAIKGNC